MFIQTKYNKGGAMRYLLLFLILFNLSQLEVFSQTRTISGKVINTEDKTPLIGVSVSVKNSRIGTITKADGSFSLDVPDNANVLVFSYVGFQSQEIEIKNNTVINVELVSTGVISKGIVVTALGVQKEDKELGYSVETIDPTPITQVRETNVINSLAGRIAGVQIVANPSGIGGSSRVTIRGERSLNINSNQPLFVVDGVPILNHFIGSSGRNNLDVDYGNGAGIINPDDIESITVLKGANATALYGSRANNGAIIITTKTGRGQKGLGISFNSSTTFETPLKLPEYQNVYGQGLNGEFAFVDGNGGGLRDGTDESWGPRFMGQLIPQFNSPRVDANGNILYYTDKKGNKKMWRGGDLNAPAGSIIKPTPWVALPDNIANFFQTGKTFTNNISFTGSNPLGDFRISLTNLDQKGFIPNTDLIRNTIAINGSYNLTNKFKTSASLTYVNSNSSNRPNLSYGTENIMYLFNCWLGRQVDLEASKDYWQRGLEGLNQFGYNYNYHDNPYFNLYENTNSQRINRFYGNITLRYQLLDVLSLQLRGGTDYNDEIRDRKRAFSTQRFPYGFYRNENLTLQENNFDFLFSYNDILTSDFSISATFGGNTMYRKYNILENLAPQLLIPEVYNLGNSKVELQNSQTISEKVINSIYGTAQLIYKNYLFLEFTARNDWSSTLPKENNSYFYPSVSLSGIVSDMIEVPDFISFAKIRLSLAQVGNDTDPYQLTNLFIPGNPFGSSRTFSESNQLANANLKPELSTSIETGFDLKFFDNHLGLEFTYYKVNSKNQILPIPLSVTSGYNSKVLNAGEIENNGFEISLKGTPYKENDFQVDLFINFTKNDSKVLSLSEGIKNFVLATRYITVEARVGERMGSMYGIGYERVKDPASPYFGQIINDVREIKDSQGNIKYVARPRATTERILLGNYNPDWLAGIGADIKIFGVNLGVLFDVRQGGKIYSHTQTVGREGGQIIETLEGRTNYGSDADDGYDISLEGNGVFSPGVVEIKDETGKVIGYKPNNAENGMSKLTSREWHTAITLGRRLIEGMIFDASFVKLREVRIGYTLPNEWTESFFLRNVNVSFVGRNLLLWSDVPHVDPEAASTSGSTIIPGVESVTIPSTRSFGFNINFSI